MHVVSNSEEMLRQHFNNSLNFYKLRPDAVEFKYGTDQAACFDISACLISGESIISYSCKNNKTELNVNDDRVITIWENHRVLVPTGWSVEIPKGHSLRIHPRSGLSLKSGIILGNCEGVVDEDYEQELFVMLYNTSQIPYKLKHGDRIAQGEIQVTKNVNIQHNDSLRPKSDSNRTGGFGSTGVSL
jgi:dUTP pyrophosphatase